MKHALGTLGTLVALAVLAFAYSGTAWAGGEVATAIPSSPTPTSTPSPLRLSIGAPDTVEAGARFSFTAWIENTTDSAILFDTTVAFVGTAWGQGVESTTPGPGTEIYLSVMTANSMTRWWRGTAPARGTAWLVQTVNLSAATTTDTRLFVSTQYGGSSTVKIITIVPASTATLTQTPASTATPSPTRTATPNQTATAQPTPDIHVGAGYSGTLEWPRGEYRTIAVAISVQNSVPIFDWVRTEFTDSTCGLDGVPGSRQDYYTGTYTNVYHRVGVLANAVLGMCRLNGRVTFEGSGRTLNFYTELRVVPAPTATPTATPDTGIVISDLRSTLTVRAGGPAVDAFKITSTGASGVTLYGYPTTYGPGLNWSFASAGLVPGSPKTVVVQANENVPAGTYRGEAIVIVYPSNQRAKVADMVITVETQPTPTATVQPSPTATAQLPYAYLATPPNYLAGREIEIPVYVRTYGQETDSGSLRLNYSGPVLSVSVTAENGAVALMNQELGSVVVGYGYLPARRLENNQKVATLRLRTTDKVEHITLLIEENHLVRQGVSLGVAPQIYYFIILNMGDANGDGSVTILDFSALAVSFGKRGGDVGFDDRVDFDRDNAVSIVDFSILARYFGQRVPGLG